MSDPLGMRRRGPITAQDAAGINSAIHTVLAGNDARTAGRPTMDPGNINRPDVAVPRRRDADTTGGGASGGAGSGAGDTLADIYAATFGGAATPSAGAPIVIPAPAVSGSAPNYVPLLLGAAVLAAVGYGIYRWQKGRSA